jgi:hypothetical protein
MVKMDVTDCCSDHFSWDDSVAFYRKALQVEKEEGFDGRVCHETHRNRSLFTHYATDYILQKVPECVSCPGQLEFSLTVIG